MDGMRPGGPNEEYFGNNPKAEIDDDDDSEESKELSTSSNRAARQRRNQRIFGVLGGGGREIVKDDKSMQPRPRLVGLDRLVGYKDEDHKEELPETPSADDMYTTELTATDKIHNSTDETGQNAGEASSESVPFAEEQVSHAAAEADDADLLDREEDELVRTETGANEVVASEEEPEMATTVPNNSTRQKTAPSRQPHRPAAGTARPTQSTPTATAQPSPSARYQAVWTPPVVPGLPNANIPVGPGNANVVSGSPNIAMPNINAYPVGTPNAIPKVETHEHPHVHWKMAALLGGGLLLEHIFRKRDVAKVRKSLAQRQEEYSKRFKSLESEQVLLQKQHSKMNAKMISLEQARVDQEQREKQVAGLRRSMLHELSGTDRLQSVPGFPDQKKSVAVDVKRQFDGSVPKQELPTMSKAEGVVGVTMPETIAPEPVTLMERQQKSAEKYNRDLVREQQQVLETAESGTASEQANERRSEVKGEPRVAGGSGAGATGVSMSHQPQQAVARHMAESRAAVRSSQASDRATPDQYKAAMNWGFAAALALIVFALLAYLFMH